MLFHPFLVTVETNNRFILVFKFTFAVLTMLIMKYFLFLFGYYHSLFTIFILYNVFATY